MVRYVRSLPETYYLAREVAEMVGCTVGMLTYLRRHTDPPLGATHQASYGGLTMHLYTPERVDEIAVYLHDHRGGDGEHRRRGPVRLWTKTEARRRARNFDRARAYRRRAEEYRAAGKEWEAARMSQFQQDMLDRLEKSRLQRWRKVHGKKK
jgi:hypothetical protein